MDLEVWFVQLSLFATYFTPRIQPVIIQVIVKTDWSEAHPQTTILSSLLYHFQTGGLALALDTQQMGDPFGGEPGSTGAHLLSPGSKSVMQAGRGLGWDNLSGRCWGPSKLSYEALGSNTESEKQGEQSWLADAPREQPLLIVCWFSQGLTKS